MAEKLFKNRTQWRKWLDKHHATETEIWLVYYKKQSGKQSVRYEEAVEEALCYGWIDSKVKRLDAERYMQRYTPRLPGSIWSKTNKKRIQRLIGDGRMTAAGLAVIEAAKQDGSWARLDALEAEPTVPEDLADALAENARAGKFFHGLAPSYQKQYLWWLSDAKRPQTRQKRLSAIVQRCAQGIKPGI